MTCQEFGEICLTLVVGFYRKWLVETLLGAGCVELQELELVLSR